MNQDERDFTDYLNDMVNAAENALEFIEDMAQAGFEGDVKTQYAVTRALEIIGEAARKIPSHIKEANPDIPWREITGMRDKVIHDYMGVSTVVVWKTAVEDLPELLPKLRQILEDHE